MNIERARTKATSAWCSHKNSHKQLDVELTAAFTNILMAETAALESKLELAWGIIANAGNGDWTKETPQWQEAAAKWRDSYTSGVLCPVTLDAV